MNQLVFMNNGRPVTDSQTLASAFEKNHADVLRDIKRLGCSGEFRLSNFAESSYTNEQSREMPKFLLTENGFTLLAMGYTGAKAMEFKEKYISEFDRMRERVRGNEVDTTQLNPILQLLIQQDLQQKQIIAQQQVTDQKITAIQETFLNRDEDWRSKINGLLNGATRRRGKSYRDMRTLSYEMLEQRAHCDLNRRLTNLKDRLKESGATKTKVDDANRLDVIESEPRLKEIYTTVVKELSIGAMN